MSRVTQQTQERLVDGLAGTSLTAGVSMNLANLNAVLETATLAVGLAAGAFALFFQIRRYFRGKKRDKELAQENERH